MSNHNMRHAIEAAKQERLAGSAAEKPTGDLTDEQIEQVWIELPLTGAYNMGEARIKFARAIERAAIAAHLERQAQANAALRKLCDQLDGMKRRLLHTPNTGQHHSYLLHEDVEAYVEEARKSLASPASQEGAHAALEEVRNQALEEAVEVCENNVCECCYTAEHCVEDIRALKTPASAERSGDHE